MARDPRITPGILRRSKQLGPIQTLADANHPHALALDGTHVYFAIFSSEDGGRVVRVAKTGGSMELVAGNQLQVAGIAVDDSDVYWTDIDTVALRVLRQPKSGGATEILQTGIQSFDIAVDASHVYWGASTTASDSIMRRAKAGGPPEVFASDQDAWKLAIDDNHVYWLDFDKDIQRRAKAPGNPAPVVTDRITHRFAVDADHIYWSTFDSVKRLSRRACGL